MMEIFIEFKKFVFSTLVSSVLFRVQEVSKKKQETIDLKISEAVWVISALRSISLGGFGTAVWRSRHFLGRRFSISCRRNDAGPFVALEIFGGKRKLKSILIPAGAECEGLQSFADALAATTAGPDKPCQSESFNSSEGRQGEGEQVQGAARVDDRSFLEVAQAGSEQILGLSLCRTRSPPRIGDDRGSWVAIWGSDCHLWDWKVMADLRREVPKISFVLPIFGEQFGIVAKIDGDLEGVPEIVKLEARGKLISVFISHDRPESWLKLIGVAAVSSSGGGPSGENCALADADTTPAEESIRETEDSLGREEACFGVREERLLPLNVLACATVNEEEGVVRHVGVDQIFPVPLTSVLASASDRINDALLSNPTGCTTIRESGDTMSVSIEEVGQGTERLRSGSEGSLSGSVSSMEIRIADRNGLGRVEEADGPWTLSGPGLNPGQVNNGPVSLIGPGHCEVQGELRQGSLAGQDLSLNQLCRLLEVPNRFGPLADLQQDLNVAHEMNSTASARSVSGNSEHLLRTDSRVLDRDDVGIEARPICPSVDKAFEYIVRCCSSTEKDNQLCLHGERGQDIMTGKKGDGCGSGADSGLTNGFEATSNWDRLGDPEPQSLLESLITLDCDQVQLVADILDAQMADEGLHGSRDTVTQGGGCPTLVWGTPKSNIALCSQALSVTSSGPSIQLVPCLPNSPSSDSQALVEGACSGGPGTLNSPTLIEVVPFPSFQFKNSTDPGFHVGNSRELVVHSSDCSTGYDRELSADLLLVEPSEGGVEVNGEEEILCVSPLKSEGNGGVGKSGLDMEWLLFNIKELLSTVGVSLTGRDQLVMEFLSSILCRDASSPSGAKGPSKRGKESGRKGVHKDRLSRELWKLSTTVNYGGEVYVNGRRGQNVVFQ